MDLVALRQVEQKLNRLNRPGMLLHRNGLWATYRPQIPVSADRLRFQRRLLDEFLTDGQDDIDKDGQAAVIVTAGPPGAGKSTHIRDLNLAGPGWRVIDADEIKKKLLAAPWPEPHQEAEILKAMSTLTLPDGYPLMKNELSSLVHNESVFLADRLIERCLEARENIVIEGTLSWEGLPPRYLRLLDQNDYGTVTILDVEVNRETALQQAFLRWANGRMATIEGRANQGGRFTPTEAITSIYDSTGQFSVCNKNAVDFFNAPEASGFDDLRLVVCEGPESESRNEYRRIVGNVQGSAPGYLKDRVKEVP